MENKTMESLEGQLNALTEYSTMLAKRIELFHGKLTGVGELGEKTQEPMSAMKWRPAQIKVNLEKIERKLSDLEFELFEPRPSQEGSAIVGSQKWVR